VGAADAIRAEAGRLGFDAIGFAPARLGPEARERLQAFLAAGMHGGKEAGDAVVAVERQQHDPAAGR
jgi:epoxyqueuosine reductase